MLYDSDKIKPATEENILKRTTEYDIYSYYIGRKVPINTKFNSPLREDNNPSFGLFVAKKSRSLLFKDQGTGETGNCFKFVRLLKGLKYHVETLQTINKDLNLGLLKRSSKGITVKDRYKPARTHIAIKRKHLTEYDLDYWYQFGITRDTLKRFKVSPISKVWVNDVIKPYIYSKKEPMYAYQIYNKFKVYRPKSEYRERFLGNCNKYDIQGMEQLRKKGELLVITKSLKDVMVLYELGYSSIAPNSESSIIPSSIMSHLRARFNKVVVLYDNDLAGIKGMIDLKKEYKLSCKFIPLNYEVKDISDFVKSYGKIEANKLLKMLMYG